MKNFVRLAAACMLLITVATCRYDKPHRSDAKHWAVREFRQVGAKMDLPRDASVLIESRSDLVVAMHPIPPPRGVLDDSVFLLTIHVTRVSTGDIEKRLKFLTEPPAPASDSDLELWMARPHPRVDYVDDGDYSYYRYDMPCSGAEVLQANVELRNIIQKGHQISKTDDDAIIRRALTSAICLPRSS